MDSDEALVEQARLLVQRLERISVDSRWSHQSSGHRGELLNWVERLDQGATIQTLSASEVKRLQALIDIGFDFLTKAAEERLR